MARTNLVVLREACLTAVLFCLICWRSNFFKQRSRAKNMS